MEDILVMIDEIKRKFYLLDSGEQITAIRSVGGLLEDMREWRIRSTAVENISTQCLADDAHRMILERFSHDWDTEIPSGYFAVDDLQSSASDDVGHRIGLCESDLGLQFHDFSQLHPSDDVVDPKYHVDVVGDDLNERLETDTTKKRESQTKATSADPTNVKEFVCFQCGFPAANRKGLYRHARRSGHNANRPRNALPTTQRLECVLCGFVTSKKFNLDRHMRRQHGYNLADNHGDIV